MTRQFESALDLVREGYSVFPAHGITESGRCTCGDPNCQNPGKHPAIKGWQKAATTDPEQIRSWWKQNSEYNPAILTGGSLAVLDVDGEEGRESLRRLEEEHGPLPDTRTVVSGRPDGGEHRYYHTNPGEEVKNSTGKLGKHLDTRGTGGYVIGPGARHSSGRFYEWKEGCLPNDCRQARLPEWIGRELKEKPDAEITFEDLELGNVITKGNRNDALNKIGFKLRLAGKTMREIDRILRKKNKECCVPPLTDKEVAGIVDSIDKLPRGGAEEPEIDDSQLTGWICAAEVEPEKTEYIIKPYIPDRKLSIIQGNPGEGKTYFACAITASVSRGEPFLDIPCKQADVLIISVEDEPGELAERLVSVGADRDHCFFIKDEEAGNLSFTSRKVEGYIRKYRPKVVFFDPFQAFLGEKVDMHRANETRPVMTKLAILAKKYDCAIILICHMSKGLSDSPGVLRSLGSSDIPASARSIIQIGRDADNPKMGLMVHVKCSNALKGRSVNFTIEDGKGVVFHGFTDKDETDFFTGGKKLRKAAENPFLYEEIKEACRRVLKDNPAGEKVPYSELGIILPAGVKLKPLLESNRGKLQQDGICIGPFGRYKNESTVTITPYKDDFLEPQQLEIHTPPTLPA